MVFRGLVCNPWLQGARHGRDYLCFSWQMKRSAANTHELHFHRLCLTITVVNNIQDGNLTPSFNEPLHRMRTAQTHITESTCNGYRCSSMCWQIACLSEQLSDKYVWVMTVAHAHAEHCSVLAAEVTLCRQWAAKHLVCVKRLKRDNVMSVFFKAWPRNWRHICVTSLSHLQQFKANLFQSRCLSSCTSLYYFSFRKSINR